MDLAARERTVAWVAVLAVAWLALPAIGYRSRDPDSRLYAEITSRMAAAPWTGWIAPDFPPGWFMTGPFREHPVGLFVPAALLAKLGYPADEAAYAMNALYQAGTLLLLPVVAAALAPGLGARSLGWLLQLLPIAFTYRVRANQEQALLLCLVVALYGTERSRQRPALAALTAAGFVGLLLVKGVFAVFGPALCALWLVSRKRESAADPRPRTAWIGLALAVVAMAAAALLYEWLYRSATGEPFWSFYVSRQLGQATVPAADHASLHEAANVAFYLGRILWFALPWSLALLAAAWTGRASTTRAGLFVAGTLLLYVAAFSLFDRRADRYVFPAYYTAGAAGAVWALPRTPRLSRLASRLDRPWVPAALFLLTFAAHVLAGALGVPTIKVEP